MKTKKMSSGAATNGASGGMNSIPEELQVMLGEFLENSWFMEEQYGGSFGLSSVSRFSDLPEKYQAVLDLPPDTIVCSFCDGKSLEIYPIPIDEVIEHWVDSQPTSTHVEQLKRLYTKEE